MQTDIVWNLPPKNKPENQRVAANPDVGDFIGAQRNVGDSRNMGEKTTKPQHTGFQKRLKFQPGQQLSGKGAESGGIQAATQEVPLVQKLGMSLGEIVAKRRVGKPTAEWQMGTHIVSDFH